METYDIICWTFSILFLFFIVGICVSLGLTSKKNLKPTSTEEEIEKEDNTYLLLFTGLITFIAIGTILLSYNRLIGNKLYNDVKDEGKIEELQNEHSHYHAGYHTHLHNGDSEYKNYFRKKYSVPHSKSLINAKNLNLYPYNKAILLTSTGILICFFMSTLLFQRTLLCKRQAYSGGESNRCCPTSLYCPESKDTEGDHSLVFELKKGDENKLDGIQSLFLKRGNEDTFHIDIGQITPSITDQIGEKNSFSGCSGTSMTGGISGVSCNITNEILKSTTNLNSFLYQCITVEGGLSANPLSKGTSVYIGNNNLDSELFFYVNQNSESLDYGISGDNNNYISIGSNPDKEKEFIKPVNDQNLVNITQNFIQNHVYRRNNPDKEDDTVCVDLGLYNKNHPCSEYKINTENGPSRRYCNKNNDCVPICYSTNNSITRNLNTDPGNNFERQTGLALYIDEDNKHGGKSYQLNNNTIGNDFPSINTKNYIWDEDTNTYAPLKNPKTYKSTDHPQKTHYTPGSAFCYNSTTATPAGNPSTNDITSEPIDKTKYPNQPNYFRKGEKYQLGFGYEPPKKNVISKIIPK